MSSNQLKATGAVKRTISYPKRIVLNVHHARGWAYPDALVTQRYPNGSYNNYRLKANQ